VSLERVRYSVGQLLSAADLTDEQSYLIEQDRRATRALHGHGVVEGLDVSTASGGTAVVVEPGLAIDGHGRLIALDDTLTVVNTVGRGHRGCVVLHVRDEPSTDASRWHEVVTATVESGPGADGVVIAELDERRHITAAPKLQSTSVLQSIVARWPSRPEHRHGHRHAVTAAGGATVGPYSHAIDADPFVFCSGQTPIDPATGALVTGDVGAQTTQCLTNLLAVLAEAGLGPGHVQRCNVYLVDMADFTAMNEAYAAAFDAPYPARTTIGVAALPLGAQVEIDLIARRP